MNLKGKRLLILGGSRISCEIIRHAKAMGIVTGVTDWYAWEKSPAKQMADEAYYVSTSDMDAMTKLIRNEKFDGVITGFTDSVLPYYAEMCQLVNLPAYGTKEQFEIFTDKSKYKKLLREFDIPVIPDYSVELDNFDESTKDISYPVIVKPVDGSGSRGITVCDTKEKLKEVLVDKSNTSEHKKVLVEQYINNPEVTVFWIFVNGKYYLTLLGNRHIKNNQEGELPLPAGYTYPAAIQPDFLRDIAPKMQRMFDAVEIKNGMMFMQCKVIEGVCTVYDIGYRLTGTLEYINIEKICGYNPMDMLIRFALTGKMEESNIEKKVDPYLTGKYSYNISVLCKPGTIAHIVGIEKIKKLQGVIDVVVAHPEGDIITDSMKGRLAQITIRILGCADSIEQMKKEMLYIQEIVHVISDKGEEMVLDGIEESDFKGVIYE